MALITFENVGITGIAACVPKNISRNADLAGLIPRQELDITIKTIGIREKRIADADVCASDLCFAAADKLLNEMEIDRSTIDALIFLSHTSDYKLPTTSTILQSRLGLSESTICFDMGLACSGYLFGLSTAFAYASLNNINRVLLLVGETLSKVISPFDKVNIPLFGDAGTATLIEKGNYSKSYFSLNSDGSKFKVLKIDAGGYRNPSNIENLQMKEAEDGNRRSGHHLFMDGLEVFNFTLRSVPKDLNLLIDYSGFDKDDIDYFVFHQANKMMIDLFAKKLKIPSEKLPMSIDEFGNTSSASIPLTIVTRINKANFNSKKNMMFSGYGAGLSWGTSILGLECCHISQLIEL